LQQEIAVTRPTKTEVIQVRAEPEMLTMLDDLRRAESDLPTRAEMVRRIIKEYAARHAAKKAKS
jgi:metal-responsive CopG/Arc/MetJ family transcriptional regulator